MVQGQSAVGFQPEAGQSLDMYESRLPVLGEFQVSVGGFGDFQGIEPVRAFGPGMAGVRQVEEPAVGSVGPFDGGLQQSAGVWVEFRLVAVQVGGMGVLGFKRPLSAVQAGGSLAVLDGGVIQLAHKQEAGFDLAVSALGGGYLVP